MTAATMTFRSHPRTLVMIPSETDPRVPGRDEVQELLAVLAHEGLHVVARHVVPLDAVVVEIVQDGQAGLVVTLRKTNYCN